MKTLETMVAEPVLGAPSADLDAIKARQRAVWASGDFSVIGTTLQIVGESLCETVDLRAGSKVLDVAAGNGNCSLAAARRWCDVTSTDYVPALLEDAQRRAAAERLTIRIQEADAEALPYAYGAFDVVLSSFGVMFTTDHRKAANELLRVCRCYGRIGLANWTPRGFVGRLFSTMSRYAPQPAAVTPASRWGTEEYIEYLFGTGASDIQATKRDFVFRYRSAEHWIDVFRTFYGPLNSAFAALPPDMQVRLEGDLIALLEEFNTSDDSTLSVPAEYLEVVVTRK